MATATQAKPIEHANIVHSYVTFLVYYHVLVVDGLDDEVPALHAQVGPAEQPEFVADRPSLHREIRNTANVAIKPRAIIPLYRKYGASSAVSEPVFVP